MKTLSIAQSVCIEYDEIMLHHRKTFSASHFGDTTDEDVDSNAKTVIRYALDTYLRWSRSILIKRLTMDILEKLKLKPLLRYLRYPPEYNKDNDLFYLVSYVYDKHLPGLRLRTLHLYEKMLQGQALKYPKDYFSGIDGIRRALICLRYVINQKYPYVPACELYELSCTQEWNVFLKDTKLQLVWKPLFHSPVEYLHMSLSPADRNDFLFHYSEFSYFMSQPVPSGSLLSLAEIGDCRKTAS